MRPAAALQARQLRCPASGTQHLSPWRARLGQDLPLRVLVNGYVYVISTDSISSEQERAPTDTFALRKASFAARVLADQILHPAAGNEAFSATNRAIVFSDQASGRLVEPWQRPLQRLFANGANSVTAAQADTALAAAKLTFKDWARKLAAIRANLRWRWRA